MSGFTNERTINNNNNINDNNNSNTSDASSSSFANATNTIYAASIIMLVFLAIQVIVFGTLLAIWLHKRIRRRREQRQNMEKHNSTTGYLRPVGYWGLPSSSAQQLPPHMAQLQQQHGQSPWHEVPPHATPPSRFAGQDTPSRGVAPTPGLAAQCNNDRVQSDFALVLGDRREMSA
ncbi:hypothetical protein F5Y03DRAFT_310646 [Xylaria venustula]|nr:hypothetical protein F5Y03DRAFT_310646 [Xylaria venustula]